MPKKSYALPLLAAVAGVSLLAGCDDRYDIEKVADGDMLFFENGVSAPVGNTTKFYLTEFITENEFLTVRDGRYAIHFDGSTSTAIDIPQVQIDPLSPTFENISLDFRASIYALFPEAKQMLDAVGYTDGPLPIDYRVCLPESEIANSTEPFSYEITDVPQEIVSVTSITAAPGTTIYLTLNADGFPTSITQAQFNFECDLPKELHVTTGQEGITIDSNGHLTLQHNIPCSNGTLTETIALEVQSVTFDPAIERSAQGTMSIDTEISYRGSVTIDEFFNINGWDPTFDLHFTLESTAIVATEAEACIATDIAPIDYSYAVTGLPEFLSDPGTCLDLTQMYINLDIANNTPAQLSTGLALQSQFADGSTSGWVETQAPIDIAANAQQNIVLTNDDAYAGTEGYIPNLDALMYRIPATIAMHATPTIPATQVRVAFGTSYDVNFNYAIEVPITFGSDINLYYEDVLAGIGDLSADYTGLILRGDAVSTLPLDIKLELKPMDAAGNVIEGIYISDIPALASNGTTHMEITIEERTEGALAQLSELRAAMRGTAANGGELRPDQYVQFNNLSLSIPQGMIVEATAE